MAERVQHTLYQVSTATALVEGIYQGAVQIAALREHGDLGLGTSQSVRGSHRLFSGSVNHCGELPGFVLPDFSVRRPAPI
jgi:alpha-acetolactate decarboxylase